MKAKILLIAALAFAAQLIFAQETGSDEKAIAQVMKMQEQAWNAGDIGKFMAGYWKSDSLTFVGKNGISYGWVTTLNNYKKSYPDKETMGRLTFTVLKMERLGPDSYLVLGKWHLHRSRDEVGGHFTLVWRKIDGAWLIISDHTS